MKFNNLHDNIVTDCNCLDLPNIASDFTSSFTRCVNTETVTVDDFKSYYELKKPLLRPLKSCKDHCKSRGVSINKLERNKEAIKEKYKSIGSFAPGSSLITDEKFVCVFKLKDNAGKVWNDSPNQPALHHTLFKCDSFDCSVLEIVSVLPLAAF